MFKVRVSQDSRFLHIYWAKFNSNIDMKTTTESLNTQKGKIRELLFEANFTNAVPWIIFVYDLQESYEYEVSMLLEKCKKDLINEEVAMNDTDNKGLNINKNYKVTGQVIFEDPFKTVKLDDYFQKILKTNLQDYYSTLKLKLPEDMPLNTFNLDYEFLMNKVLHNLHRNRDKYRLSYYNMNSVSEHLPLIDENKVNCNLNYIDYQTDERIKAIKKFVFLNKKRKNKALLKLKRKILLEEVDRLESYEEIREMMEKRIKDVYQDLTPSEKDVYIEY